MKFNFFSAALRVGAVVQATEIRLVVIKKMMQRVSKKNRRLFFVEAACRSALPEGTVVDGKIKNWDVLGKGLSELLHTHRLKGSYAASCLPAHLVWMQRMQLPSGLSGSEMEAEVNAFLKHHLPKIDEALGFDFFPVLLHGQDDVNVYVAATRKAYLFQYVRTLEKAGLKLRTVDVDLYAVVRAVERTVQFSPTTGAQGIVYVDNGTATLIIFHWPDIKWYQQWELHDFNTLLEDIEHRIQLYDVAFPQHIRIPLLICGEIKGPTKMATLSGHPVATLSSFEWASQFAMADHLNKDFMDSFDFLVACGTAMRDFPKW